MPNVCHCVLNTATMLNYAHINLPTIMLKIMPVIVQQGLTMLQSRSSNKTETHFSHNNIVKLGDNLIVTGQQNLTAFKQHVKGLPSTRQYWVLIPYVR